MLTLRLETPEERAAREREARFAKCQGGTSTGRSCRRRKPWWAEPGPWYCHDHRATGVTKEDDPADDDDHDGLARDIRERHYAAGEAKGDGDGPRGG